MNVALPAWFALITHDPGDTNDTTPAVSVQPVLDASTVSTTGRPDDAVAVGEYPPPTVPVAGPVKVIIWFCFATTTVVALTSGAALNVVLPAWFALITHDPADTNDTTPAVSVQPLLDASTANTTGRPDDAVAVGVYPPPTIPEDGPVNVIV